MASVKPVGPAPTTTSKVNKSIVYTSDPSAPAVVVAWVHIGAGERPTLEAVGAVENGEPSGTLVRLRGAGATVLLDQLTRHTWDRPVMADWALPDGWLTGGDIPLVTRTLTAIPTPGHTRGHMVFLDGEAGLMFTGDHVLPHITPSIGFELRPSQLPLGEFLDSLRLLSRYPDARLLPAHGPVADSVHGRVAELIGHHDGRLREAWHAVSGGATTAYEAANVLTWTRRHRAYADLDMFNQMLAVLETTAHLDLLAHQGFLKSSVEDGIVVYCAVQPPAS